MAFTLTPNMNLVIPGVGTEPGPEYAIDVNNSLTIIDGHNHTAGSGALITPAALSINTSLPLNNNRLTNAAAVTYTAQTLPPPNGSTYVSGVDLYFVDGSGNNIRLTNGGSVNATSSGLSSGFASASFVGGALVVNQSALTPGNLQVGSILLGNNTPSSNFLTLQPPNAMGASYTLTLPILPAQTDVMTLDAAGNMGTQTYDQVGQNMTSVGANAVAQTMDSVGTSSLIATMGQTGANSLISNSLNANLPGSAPTAGSRSIVTGLTANNLVITRGHINGIGGVISGEGFSVTLNATGIHTITFLAGLYASPPAVVATIAGLGFISVNSPSSTSVIVITKNTSYIDTAYPFHFIAVGPRT